MSDTRPQSPIHPASAAPAAIRLQGVSKTYDLFPSVGHEVVYRLGLSKLMPWMRAEKKVFTALHDVSLEVPRGSRLGIVGRNGAGKTTLLKIISGTTQPTGGVIDREGTVSALMRVGTGFHPELTGRANIKASLALGVMRSADLAEAEAEIIDFCELGDFLDQPFKIYSLGMKSRLQFACATAIKPDILVIDEILGAGDAYFSAKSATRMERFISGGCTLIVVSHSMGQVLQFCTDGIWIEKGEIAMRSSALEVVKSYEKFSHELRRQSKLSEADQISTRRQSTWLAEKAASALNMTLTARDGQAGSTDAIERWSVDDSPLQIASVTMHKSTGEEAAAFSNGERMSIRVAVKARRAGTFPCCCGIVIYNAQGQMAGRFVSDVSQYTVAEGETRTAELILDNLLYGSGSYLVSVSIHERLDLRQLSTASWYDLYGRSHQFDILEDPIDAAPMFRHPHRWSDATAVPKSADADEH